MEKVTLIGNLMTTLGVLFSSSFFFYTAVSILVFFVLKHLIISNGGEMSKKIYYGYSAAVFSLFIIIYSDSILKLWDKLMDNLFLNIYFPSLGIYIGIIIISIVMLITSIIKKKISKITKKINIISSISLLFLFFLSLDTIVSNNIDISSDTFLYTNNKLLALIEVSTGIFALWMIALGVIYCINKISNWFDIKETEKTNDQPVNNYQTIIIEEKTELPKAAETYSSLVKNLLETKETHQEPVKTNPSKDLLINEYKEMREYLMKLKQTKNNSYYPNDIFLR